jgi:hypothetical protein
MILQTMIQVIAEYMGLLSLTISFPLYITYILWRNDWKVLHSISDSYYILKKKERNEEILFTLFTFFLGIGTILQYPLSPLFFFSGMGFFWVGTQTQFKSDISIKGTIHYIGAVIGIVGSLIGLGLNGMWLPLLIMGLGTPLIWWLRNQKGDFIWWVEILAFISIIYGLWGV